jgi:hypothetical protein
MAVVGSENPILGCEIFILEQEFLIDQPGDERQQASPFVVCHEEYSFIINSAPRANNLTTRDMVQRWVASAWVLTEKHFRRIDGHAGLWPWQQSSAERPSRPPSHQSTSR